MEAIHFHLNGIPRKVITDPGRKLLEVIRKDLRCTGTKEGCGAGHCGTCTELLPDDRLQVWIGAADMGQGAATLFWQVAAETMGFPLERVLVCTTDTRFTPDGNFSAGSRQTYVSGRAVQMAVEELKKTMEDNGVSGYDQMKSKGLPTLYKAVNRPETTKLDPGDGHGVPWETFSTIILRSSSKGICGERNV